MSAAASDRTPPVQTAAVPSVMAAFAAVADRHQDASAVSSPGIALTYGELAARVAACADRLDALLPEGSSAPVAVLGTPSAALVVAMLGVVLSGRPLVVLDSQLPVGRLQQIQDASRAAVCVVQSSLRERALEVEGFPVVTDLADSVVPPTEAPGRRPGALLDGRSEPEADSIATVVFTSGSTGRPKGVLHSHGLIVSEAAITAHHLGVVPGERLALVLPPSFSLGEHSVFGALLNGASLHVYDPRDQGVRGLPAWFAEERITVASLTPSLLRALAGAVPPGTTLPDLRLLASAGEALQGRDVELARRRLGDVTVVNGLGSSESCQTTFHPLAAADPVPDGAVPVGRAALGKEVQVVGPDGEPLPPEQPGSVRVRARFLASGYLGADEAGEAPFGGQGPDGRRSFVMADRGRYDCLGVLHALGRVDDAVKVRGYLVEPAEVEGALRDLPHVADAAVMGIREDTGMRLVGYVAPLSALRTPSPAQLRRGLLATLPSWMVPSDLILLSELPRTERGKVDRAALPPPPRPTGTPPAGIWEQRIAALYAAVLDRPDVGRDQTFTSLGGDSLAIEELLTRLTEEYRVHLTSSHIAEAPTVRELAVLVATEAEATGREPKSAARSRRSRHGSVVALRTEGPRTPVLCFAGAGAGGQAFLPLADALGSDQPVFAFQPHGMEEWALPDLTIGMAARRHLRNVRRIQPQGPYRLVGHSMGGLVALRLAHLLSAAGEEVASVTLIDTFVPLALARRVPGTRATAAREPATPPAGGAPGADTEMPSSAELWRRRLKALIGSVLRPSAARTEGLRELGVRVSMLHRPRGWHGPVNVYLSHLNEDDPAAWATLLTGPVRWVTLPGDHNSLLRTPHVEEIARGIAADDLR